MRVSLFSKRVLKTHAQLFRLLLDFKRQRNALEGKKDYKEGEVGMSCSPKRARSKGYREGEVGGRSCRTRKGAHAEEDDV